jgi:hypothetical protein
VLLGFGRFAGGDRIGMPFADAALRECASVGDVLDAGVAVVCALPAAVVAW